MSEGPARIDSLDRAAIDRAEAADLRGPDGAARRPRDAATLILLERHGGAVRVLIGRRHRKHAFMPGRFVFPGGRTDRADGRIAVAADLHPGDEGKMTDAGPRVTPARVRAIALSAIRETYEEAGLLIGEKGPFATRARDWQGFVRHGVRPAPGRLRFIARAITPPGRVRRYDTRFFATWRENVALELPQGGPTEELEELMWLPLAEAMAADIPLITRTVLMELEARLAHDPTLEPGGPVPFYAMQNNHFSRWLL